MAGPGAGRDVVIVDAVRTPVGRGHPERGVYRGMAASTLLAQPLTALFDRTGLDPARVDEVVAGCVQQFGEQSLNVGRNAWLEAGLPLEVPATTIDVQCGSAQQAVSFGAALVASGARDAVVACGVEHMGHNSFAAAEAVRETYGEAHTAALLDRYPLVSQGVAAEAITERWDLTRRELDELSVRSHRRAARATEDGRFTREIVPVPLDDGTVVRGDQGIRPESTVEVLGGLRPAFVEGGTITAGNSSQVSDGAAAVLLMSREAAAATGVPARARVVDHITVGVDPVSMLTGPIPATRRLLERSGLSIDDIDLFEVNEAFAPVVLAWQRETGADPDRVNVNGGAIALGHPLGSTGARLVATLLHELERTGGRRGIVTMCCAGGIGTGTLIERLDADDA